MSTWYANRGGVMHESPAMRVLYANLRGSLHAAPNTKRRRNTPSNNNANAKRRRALLNLMGLAPMNWALANNTRKRRANTNNGAYRSKLRRASARPSTALFAKRPASKRPRTGNAWWEVLGVRPTATRNEIERAHAMARRTTWNAARLRELNSAANRAARR